MAIGNADSSPERVAVQIVSAVSIKQYDAKAPAQPVVTDVVLSEQKSHTVCVDVLIETRQFVMGAQPRSVVDVGAAFSYSV